MELYLGGGANYGEYVQHPVLAKHFDLIEGLAYDRVFGIFYDKEDGFWIEECCDNWFKHALTKEECLELSEMFAEVAEAIGTQK
jgi:hypothetical protein